MGGSESTSSSPSLVLLGKFAVGEGRRRFGSAPQPRREAARTGPAPDSSSRPDDADQPVPSPGRRHAAVGRARRARWPSRTTSEPSEASAAGLGRELPIPGYDTLAASQVVERLASLTPAELEAVRRHEAATRRRRTVLHRIAQLSSERDIATA